MYYVYILKCSDNKPYTGCTDNLKERIERHKNGYVPATKERRPLNLDVYFAFKDKYKAFDFEKYLKSGSEYIRIIPLFEGVDTQINAKKILKEYLKLHKETFNFNPSYLRIFIARAIRR